MVAVPVPFRAGKRRAFRVPGVAALTVVTGAIGALIRPVRPVLANAAQIPLTLAAYGCLSTAAFLFNTLVGLASTAVLLVVLEHQLADE